MRALRRSEFMLMRHFVFIVLITGSRKRSEVPYLPSNPSSAADEVHV